MKNLITFMMLILSSTVNTGSQNLQNVNPAPLEKYIVLANPTARNIEIIRFLSEISKP